jgi:hypothetical protein
MADRIRKKDFTRKAIHCKVSLQCYSDLARLSGEFGFGWAIEELVKTYNELRLTTESLQTVVVKGKIQ